MVNVKVEKVGSGGFGCAYYPSLHCKDNIDIYGNQIIDSFYKNKISKATTENNAINEINEQVSIDNADSIFSFHLPPPVSCKIENTIENKKHIDECYPLKTRMVDINHTQLLLIKNGGMDLDKFVNYLTNPISKLNYNDKHKIINYFWKNSIILIKAIQLFNLNNIIHNDIKPQNIVFNKKNGKLNIIDFGLVVNFNKYQFESSSNFAYTMEKNILENMNKFKTISKINDKEFDEKLGVSETINIINKYKISKNKNININIFNKIYKELSNKIHHNKILYFLSYVSELEYDFLSNPSYKMKYGFHNSIDILNILSKNIYKGKSFNEILNKSKNTQDMYGIGFSLIYVLLHTFEYINNDEFIIKIYKILFSMMHPDCFKRPDDIAELFNKYKETVELLYDSNCNKGFERNINTGRCIKQCNDIQERNLKTNKCVKKCTQKKIRNIKSGRCKKYSLKNINKNSKSQINNDISDFVEKNKPAEKYLSKNKTRKIK